MTGTDMIPVPILSEDTNDNFQFISGQVSNFQSNHKDEKKTCPIPMHTSLLLWGYTSLSCS